MKKVSSHSNSVNQNSTTYENLEQNVFTNPLLHVTASF